MKKFLRGTWNLVKKFLKITFVVLGICFIIQTVSNFMTHRVEKNRADRSKASVTSMDTTQNDLATPNVNNEPAKIQSNVIQQEQQKTIEVVEDKSSTISIKEQDRMKKDELKKRYFYVSDPIFRNDKKYFQVRQEGYSGCGWVDYETLNEVILVGEYDAIGDEKEIAGRSYVSVSTPNDEGYAYGLLSLDTFEEVVPCKTYRDVDIDNNNVIVECLQTDRETVDVYQPDENTQLLVKKMTR